MIRVMENKFCYCLHKYHTDNLSNHSAHWVQEKLDWKLSKVVPTAVKHEPLACPGCASSVNLLTKTEILFS